MEQVTFADVEYEGKKRRTRRELFLERMEALIVTVHGDAERRVAWHDPLPDETTILGPAARRYGYRVRAGTIVDASMAPSRRRTGRGRGMEMHQTRKGNEWHFGMRRTSGWTGDGTGAWRAGDAGEHARSSGGGGVASRRRTPTGGSKVGGHGRP